MRVPVRNRGKLSGFTLVEMAIVLVIIGIILAGVMKGRDIVRGAQVKQFSQQFAQKWATIASSYYDKTGQFLNDGERNGGPTGNVADGMADGTMSARGLTIMSLLQSVGIDPCALVKSKVTAVATITGVTDQEAASLCNAASATSGATDIMNPFQSQVDGEYAALTQVRVDIVGLTLTEGGQQYLRNVVVLYNVPVDVAQGIDTLVDGTANGVLGSCVGLDDTDDAGNVPNEFAQADAVTATQWAFNGGTFLGGLNAGVAQTQTVGIVMDY